MVALWLLPQVNNNHHQQLLATTTGNRQRLIRGITAGQSRWSG
jgi:hypothetical protein